jgi:hypothetical protein
VYLTRYQCIDEIIEITMRRGDNFFCFCISFDIEYVDKMSCSNFLACTVSDLHENIMLGRGPSLTFPIIA